MNHKQTPVVIESDSITLHSCATEFFRWVRAGIEMAEETPALVKSAADDIQRAWHDSAKQ